MAEEKKQEEAKEKAARAEQKKKVTERSERPKGSPEHSEGGVPQSDQRKPPTGDDSGGGKEAKPKQEAAKKEPKQTQEAPAGEAASKEDKGKEKPDIQLSESMKGIISSIQNMTVLELSNLVKALEDKFGVTAVQPVVAGVAGAVAPGAAAEEEKSTFAVVLASVGSNKIQVIKEIRGITTLGLKEAKDLVESAPKTVKEGVAKDEAEDIKKKLETVGAKVELK